VDAWVCPHCASAQQARKSSRLSTFPSVLMVHMRRFVYEGWVPEKLDIEVRLADEEEAKQAQTVQIDLDILRAKGHQAGEELLPKEAAAAAPAAGVKVADPAIVSGLEAMGFGSNACKRAALAVDNASADAAASWLFANMEAPDLNDPLPEPAAAAGAGAGASSSSGASEPSAEAVANLEAMGFDAARCRHALRQCANSPERAIEWLFSHADEDIPAEGAAAGSGASAAAAAAADEDPVMIDAAPAGYELFAFVTHMGKSTGSGHYIAHVRKQGKWLQFNDHKVSFVKQPLRAAAFAYLLFFKRIAQ
jgi:ubiquitin carboxyl-terminal hydrolase 5/13